MYDFDTIARERRELLVKEAENHQLALLARQTRRSRNIYRVIRKHAGQSLIAAGHFLLAQVEEAPAPPKRKFS